MKIKTIVALMVLVFGAQAQAATHSNEKRTLFAYLKVRPGTEAQFLKAAKNVIQESRKEPGNLVYILQESINDPTQFIIYELFKSDAALELHRKAKHTVRFLKEVDSILIPGQFVLEKYDHVR